MTTYEEWRVTGTWPSGRQAELIWRTADGETEAEARSYLSWARNGAWTDGPHLHKRTVTVSEWTEVDA